MYILSFRPGAGRGSASSTYMQGLFPEQPAIFGAFRGTRPTLAFSLPPRYPLKSKLYNYIYGFLFNEILMFSLSGFSLDFGAYSLLAFAIVKKNGIGQSYPQKYIKGGLKMEIKKVLCVGRRVDGQWNCAGLRAGRL